MIQLSTNPELIDKFINYSDLGYSEVDYSDDESYNQMGEKFRKQIERDIKDAMLCELKDWDLSSVKSPKFVKGIELVKDLILQGKKVVVWGFFVDTLKKITRTLKASGINVQLIYGGTPKNEREEIINRFKKPNNDVQIIVSNPNTLGESVSLHHVAHDAVYFEYNYNLTFMLQSRDRIHRLGLSENQKTNYYYLMTETNQASHNFIDWKIYDRLLCKAEIMSNAIDGELLIPEFKDDEIEEMKKIIEAERKYSYN